MSSATVHGTTATTVLKHFTIKGGAISKNGYFEFRFFAEPYGTGGTKTLTIYLDGKAYLLLPYVASSQLPNIFELYVWNANATNSQVTFWYFVSAQDTGGTIAAVGSFYSSAYARGAANSVDTTQPINCTITGKLAVATDSLAFGYLSVEAISQP